MESWIDEELAGCEFVDKRIGKRLRDILNQLSNGIGGTIPFACQDWAATKAAYLFPSNSRVNEAEILKGHFQASRERFTATNDSILVLHDTTEFSYRREKPELIGKTKIINKGHYKKGQPIKHTLCGLLMHSGLALTLEGLPLGLAAVKFWTRKKFKGTNALRNEVNLTRMPIEGKESIRWLENMRQSTELFGEPQRCIQVGDRESDIYELFDMANKLKTHFLVRTSVDRLAGNGDHTISKELSATKIKGYHRVEVRDKKNRLSQATLEIKYRRVRVLPPEYKQKRYAPLVLTVIHAREREIPEGRDRIDWKLMTDLPVRSRQEAIEKLDWYSQRWKIETFSQNNKIWM